MQLALAEPLPLAFPLRMLERTQLLSLNIQKRATPSDEVHLDRP